MIRAVADRYVLLPHEERAGGASKVIKATDHLTGNQVAVKLIPRADTDDTHRVFFRREVEALDRLTHPNIVSLLDHGTDDDEDAFFLVFPWLDRRLADALPPPDEIGWDDFADAWGLPLLDALAYAHERDVIHRDVKPSNILVAADGTPLLADFGISKIRSRIVTEATVADFVSRPYAPPDLAGMSRASRDVWGFAATTLRCFTSGRFDDYPDLDRALDDADVPPAVVAVLRQCVSRDPEARPRNAIVLRSALREIHDQRTRKWVQPRPAQLIVRDEAASRIVTPPLHRDADAVERALRDEFAHGTHLARFLDPRSGELMPDTLDLVGQRRRLRLALVQGQPTFVVTKAFTPSDRELDAIRRSGWPVVAEVHWTSAPQPPTAARQTMARILAALDEHYMQAEERQQLLDENRVFDVWLDLLAAKDDVEAERSGALAYESVAADGKRIRFQLTEALEADVLGEERVCRVRTPGSSRATIVGAAGVVVAQDDQAVTLAYKHKQATVPPAGELVVDPGASAVAVRRQRDAVVSVRSENSVRPQLRAMLVDPTRITVPALPSTAEWFDDKLDEDKQAAIVSALECRDFCLLEGPPGTGKTAFITELVRQELRRNPDARILLVSQTHVAVDNALVRLVNAGLDNVVRLGRPDNRSIADEVKPHLLEHRMPHWVQEIRARAEQHLAQMAQTASIDLDRIRGAVALLELAAELDEQDKTRAQLAAIAGSAGPARSVTRTAGREDDGSTEASGLYDSLQRVGDRIVEVRGNAATRLAATVAAATLSTEAEVSAAAVRRAFDALADETPELRKLAGVLELQAEWFRRIESSRDLEAVLLRRARIVAGTCLGFLSHPAVRDLEFDLCILDEASKATATETLVPLARSKRWVLVGDPNQLPPMQEEVLDHPDIMDRHNLERADVERSLFRDLLDHAPAQVRHRLTYQYRMHPGIGDLVSHCFYDGILRSMTSQELPGWTTRYKPVTWLDTGRSEQRRESPAGTSWVNHQEARVIKRAVADLRTALDAGTIRTDDGRPLRVLVLTAYRKQMDELRRAVAGPASPLLDIEVNTVDAVQGREADVTFYSVVRSNTRGELGFLGPRHWRRINVALSRARFGLVIVGDAPFCETHDGPLRDVLTHIRKHPDTCRIGHARA